MKQALNITSPIARNLNFMKYFSIPTQELAELHDCGKPPVTSKLFANHSFVLPILDSFHLIDYHAEVYRQGELIKLKPGDWIFTPHQIDFTYTDRLEQGKHHIYFHFQFRKALGQKRVELPMYGNLGTFFPEIWEMGLHAVADFKRTSTLQKWGASSSLQRLLLRIGFLCQENLLDFQLSKTRRRSDHVISRVAHWIESHACETFSIHKMTRQLELTPTYLRRCFRKKYGMSITQYHLQSRMEQVAHLIQQSTLSFKSIAARTGFSDSHHFNKRVRSYFKESPRTLRERLTRQKNAKFNEAK